MIPYPRPSREPWHYSETQDYERARSDEERRRILSHFGYDDAHKSEVWRLFPVRPHLHGKPVKKPDVRRYLKGAKYLGKIIDWVLKIIEFFVSY